MTLLWRYLVFRMYYKVYEINGKEMDMTHNVHGGDMTVFCEGCLSSLAAIL
jgi:hypothetical protein